MANSSNLDVFIDFTILGKWCTSFRFIIICEAQYETMKGDTTKHIHMVQFFLVWSMTYLLHFSDMQPFILYRKQNQFEIFSNWHIVMLFLCILYIIKDRSSRRIHSRCQNPSWFSSNKVCKTQFQICRNSFTGSLLDSRRNPWTSCSMNLYKWLLFQFVCVLYLLNYCFCTISYYPRYIIILVIWAIG